MECPHGLDTDWCTICKHGAEKETVTVEFTFQAKYEGHCPECNLPIMLGQMIAKMSNERYIHEGCS